MSLSVRAPARPLILALIAAMAIAILPAGAAKPVLAVSPDVVISEVYGGGGNLNATLTHDFIELFNRGSASVSLNGWSVQYASSTGTSWQRTNLTNVSLAPGQSYLVQEAQGAGGTTPLPTPDASGVIPMSGTAGKVALLNTQVTIVATICPAGPTLVDVVGYGTGTNCFEGAGPTPTLSNTTSAARTDACVDTDETAADFTVGAPNPQNTGSPLDPCGSDDAPVSATCGATLSAVEGTSSVTRQITATDPDDVVDDIALTSVGPANAEITLGATTPAAADGGTASATLTVGTSNPGTYQAVITASNDDATNPQSATCTVNVVISTVRGIGEIQGTVSDSANGLTHRSPFAPASGNGLGQTVATRGVIAQLVLSRTAAGVRNYGFFLQEPTTATDGDPTTSDGIFVFMNTFPTLIGGYVPTVGDEVIISGRVSEFFNLTQISSASLVEVIRHDVDLAVETPRFVVDPPADNNDANRYWERHEGMQAQLPAGSLVQGGRSVFPSTADAEIYFYRDDYSPLADRADPYARRIFRDPHPLDDIPDVLFDNGNGFRFLIGSLGVKAVADDENLLVTPANTNDVLTNEPAGGIYFGFSKYQIQIAEQPTFSSGADPSLNGAPEAADPAFDWTSSTYNVENLYDFRDDPTDGCDFLGNSGCPGVSPPFDFVPTSQADYDAQLAALATQIIEDLKSPDLILTQEGEDQDICSVVAGAMSCGGAAAGDGRPDTLQELALQIASFGGPAYGAANDRNGADDRGIVSGFLYRTDRVELLPVAAGDAVLGAQSGVVYARPSTPLAYNGDVQNPKALNTTLPTDLQQGSTLDGSNVFTRPPQVGHFRVWRDGIGTSVFLDVWALSNHFSSTPDGRVFQRKEQAAYLAAIVDAIEADDPGARVIAGGDFNVFPQPDDPFAPGQPIGTSGLVGPSDQLKALYDQGLVSLWDHLAGEIPTAAYSYVFQGQAQTLDSQFISDDLDAEFEAYRVAHINADFAADFEGDGARGASDHDPSQARYELAVTIGRLDTLVRYLDATGELRGKNTARNLLDRLAKAAASEAAGKTDAARSQLIAFADQVRELSPRFIDADVATGLREEVAVLLGG